MIVVMKQGASKELIQAVEARIVELGYRAHSIYGVERTVIGCVGREDKTPLHALDTMPGVEAVIPILKPSKLVSRDFKAEATIVDVDGVKNRRQGVAMMAGPCSVESERQIVETARAVRPRGRNSCAAAPSSPAPRPMRFRASKRRAETSRLFARPRRCLKIVTEVVSVADVDLLARYADMIQIGARNCQNFALLTAAAQRASPCFSNAACPPRSRNTSSFEYLLNQGNYNVVLCERGIRHLETATRFTLDLNAVPVIKKETTCQ
jgi:3-deoxy-7-phosphoheptulonate synthase